MRGMFELVKPNTNSISGYSNCFPFLENAFENWVNYELKEAFYLACYKNGIKCFLPCCISFSFFKEENPSIASSYLLWLQAIKKVLSLEGSSISEAVLLYSFGKWLSGTNGCCRIPKKSPITCRIEQLHKISILLKNA